MLTRGLPCCCAAWAAPLSVVAKIGFASSTDVAQVLKDVYGRPVLLFRNDFALQQVRLRRPSLATCEEARDLCADAHVQLGTCGGGDAGQLEWSWHARAQSGGRGVRGWLARATNPGGLCGLCVRCLACPASCCAAGTGGARQGAWRAEPVCAAAGRVTGWEPMQSRVEPRCRAGAACQCCGAPVYGQGVRSCAREACSVPRFGAATPGGSGQSGP